MPAVNPTSPEPATAAPNPLQVVGTEPVRSTSVLVGVIRAARPKQWAKNVLVFAAPAAASVLDDFTPLLETIACFVAFCLVSSATYLFNDVRDVESDRAHPTKRNRPIAQGIVSPRLATVVGLIAGLAGFAVAAAVSWELCFVVVCYVAISTSYTLWLKHVAVVDLAAVAAGFIIRAVAGGVATDVPISRWFLIVASFGSLFMVACKRQAEHVELGDDRGSVRATLDVYPLAYLRFVWMTAASITIAAYCLWAFEQADGTTASHFPWYPLSIAPFVIALLRYGLVVETGRGGAPEEIILGDRPIQVIGFIWIVLYGAGVYLGH
jgi:decaprenyl-phosphate phosphoribosyltransferase